MGNTLLFPDWKTILKPLVQIRQAPQVDDLQALERKTKREFDRVQSEKKETNLGFWRIFHGFLLADLEISDEALLHKLTLAMADSSHWNQSRPGTRETLDSIAKSYRLGVISNADGKIQHVLARCGIADCFQTVTDSGIVGYEKPHAAIFQAACRDIAVQPEHCLYVGDVYSVDYLGATRTGMRAVLFDVAGTYRENGLPRVESLQELQTWLEKDQ